LALLLVALSSAPAPQAPRGKRDIPTITREASKAVVLVIASDKNGKEIHQGSGFVVSRNGQVVTNYHVVERASTVVIKFSDGAFYLVDGFLAIDEENDIAVLKASGKNFPIVPLGDSNRVQAGEEVVAIGSPLALESTVSNGIISAVRVSGDDNNTMLQITAPISPGSSGGPLFNMRGEVVGITTLQFTKGQNLNFAIPINEAKPLLLSKTLIPFANKSEETQAATPEQKLGSAANDAKKTWRNLTDGQTYRTRIIGDMLYLESVEAYPTRIADIVSCEFKRGVVISWIGTCWQRNPRDQSTYASVSFISLFSDTRIEGGTKSGQFVLVPVD
jgi:Trypsin-like peptidase domain